MRARAIALVLGLASVACDGDPASSDDADDHQLVVSVQRWDEARQCFATISQAVPDPELGLRGSCEGDGALSAVIAGVDRLRIVIDYGTSVRISAATKLPAPTLALLFDGAPSMVAPRFGEMQRAGKHLFFLATYDVPLIDANELVIAAEAVPDFRDETPESFAVAQPSARVEIEGCAAGGCGFVGGVQAARVVVTIPSREPQPVTLRSHLADGSRETTRTLTTARIGETLTRVVTTVDTPLVGAPATWVLEAHWRTQTTTTTVALARPTLALEVLQCPSTPCDLIAAVGRVRAVVTIPGPTAQAVTMRSIVGGFDDSAQSKMSVAHTDASTQVTFDINTPMQPTSSWQLEARWQTIDAQFGDIRLAAPTIDATIGCPAPCTLQPGATVALVITAPRDIRSPTASYATYADAAPLVLDATLTQSTANETTALRSWTTTLTVPDRPGATWVIRPSVAGYEAATLTALIATPCTACGGP